MFQQINETKVSANDAYDELFRTVFWVTFGLTVIVGPMLLFRTVGGILLLPFSAIIGLGIVMKAIIVAAVIYLVFFRILSLFLPKPLVFVGVSTLAAFVSVLAAMIINVDAIPLSVGLDMGQQNMGYLLGSLAAIIAFFVSSFVVGAAR